MALVFVLPSAGQTSTDETIYKAVPVALRTRFIERLNLYIEYSLRGGRKSYWSFMMRRRSALYAKVNQNAKSIVCLR